MDTSFEYFLKDKGFGPPLMRRDVDPAYANTYTGKLPDQLLAYWIEHGWCGYGEGLFWTVDPADYADVVDAWIGDTPLAQRDDYYVIARGAFGKLYLWGAKTGNGVHIDAPYGWIFPTDRHEKYIRDGDADFIARTFFSTKRKESLDVEDAREKPLFARALKKLGPLAPDEMYGFEPALCLGFDPALTNLAKVKAVEHLLILAQLCDRQIMENPYLKYLDEMPLRLDPKPE